MAEQKDAPKDVPDYAAVKDAGTTLLGGAFAWDLLRSVVWTQVLGGETAKVIVALLILGVGCWMYRDKLQSIPQ